MPKRWASAFGLFITIAKKALNWTRHCKKNKEIVDYKVESALLKAALGYKTTESKVTLVYEKGELIKTIKERITRTYPPNVAACQTWLFNRQREKWKRNRDNEIAVEDDKTINITITRAGNIEE